MINKSENEVLSMNKFQIIILLTGIILAGGCSQDPLSNIESPVVYSGTSGIEWVIFDDSLNTLGGDVMIYPSDPGVNILKFKLITGSDAYSGDKYFHFEWTGDEIFWEADPPDNPQDTYEAGFAGISLIVATSPDFYDITEPIDMSDKGYNKIIFYARGRLDTGYYAKFEGPCGAVLDKPDLKESWTKYEIQLLDLHNVKDFFKVTIYNNSATVSNHGAGGYIDIDFVKYSK